MKLLSIIIPVYNVEHFIHSCINSVFSQGLEDDAFEVIIVNDGSEDKSIDQITDFLDNHTNIIYIDLPHKGVSVARNYGIQIAHGKYIVFVDSDDVLVPGALHNLRKYYEQNQYDIVICGYKRLTDAQIDDFHLENNKGSFVEFHSNKDLFLRGFNPYECYVWRTIFRKEFIVKNNISFIPGIYYEDIPFTYECYIKAKCAVKTDSLLYLYRYGHSSIVSSINLKKAMDFNRVIERLWLLNNCDNIDNEMRDKLNDSIFSNFSFSMCSIAHESVLIDKRKLIVNDLFERIPNIRFSNNMKQKMVSFVFRKTPLLFLSLRSIYGRIFEDYLFRIKRKFLS